MVNGTLVYAYVESLFAEDWNPWIRPVYVVSGFDQGSEPWFSLCEGVSQSMTLTSTTDDRTDYRVY
jgi:hypothetical protein